MWKHGVRAAAGVLGVALLTLCGSPPAHAQVIAPGARTLFSGAGMYRTTLRVLHTDDLVSGSSSVRDPQDRRTTLTVSDHSLAWGIAPSWTLAGVVPFVRRVQRREGVASLEESGIADPTVLVQYDGLYRRNWAGGFARLALQGTALLPLGSDELTRDSLDLGLAVIFTRVQDRHWVGGDASYVLTTGGPGDLEHGEILSADAYYLYRIGPGDRQRALLVWELNATREGAARLAGERVRDSGGETLALAFGAEIFVGDRTIIEAAISSPVYRDLNGTQPDVPATLLLGLRRVW